MRTLSCLLAALSLAALSLSGCNPTPAPGDAGLTPAAVASAKTHVSTPRRPLRRGPSAEAPAPQAPDPRTPEQIAAAACAGGKCKGTAVKPLLTAGAVPIIPASWTVANWYIDPAASVACAKDTNSGTAATCTGGCTGSVCASGIGPIKTYQELSAHRWGCLGNPAACPRLRQDTAIHFLSSQTDNTDPVYLKPGVENGATVSIQGNLPTPVCSPTLSAFANRSVSGNALAHANFGAGCGAGLAAGDLVIDNASEPACAFFIHDFISGTSYHITQPLGQATVPLQAAFEVTPSNDAVSVYVPIKVNVVDVEPTFVDFATGGSTTSDVTLYHITVLDPTTIDADPLTLGYSAAVLESVIQRYTTVLPTNSFALVVFQNVVAQGAVETGSILSPDLSFEWIGGTSQGLNPWLYGIIDDVAIDTDVEGAAGRWGTNFMFGSGLAARILNVTGELNAGETLVSLQNSFFGPDGVVDAVNTARLFYTPGAAGAVATFHTAATGGGFIEINGQGIACVGEPSGITAACGSAVSPAGLDADFGATSGCLFLPGGGAFCNYGP